MIAIMIFGLMEPLGSLAMMEQENRALLPSSSLNEADYHNDNGNHQRDVNEPSHRITGHQPQQPQNYQYYSNRPQHGMLLLEKCLIYKFH